MTSAERPVRTTGYYQLVQGGDGAFRFTLRSGNHETVVHSGVYWSRESALAGAALLRELGQQDAHFKVSQLPEGRCYFEVLDAQGQTLAKSTVYLARSGLNAGIASVKRQCVSERFRGLVFRTEAATEPGSLDEAPGNQTREKGSA